MITFYCTMYFAVTLQFFKPKAKGIKHRIRYLVKKSVQNVFLDFFFITEKNKIFIA